jgi:hypothetical protein
MKAAVLLQESGQSTSMTMVAVDRLNMGVGIRSTLIPSWASLLLASPHPGVPVRVASASPMGVRNKATHRDAPTRTVNPSAARARYRAQRCCVA